MTALELDLAPPVPGIYAWYVRFPLATDDWSPRVEEGIDQAAVDIERAVDDYARYHQASPIEITGTDDYELPWSGVLTRRSVADSVDGTISSAGNKLEPVFTNPEKRRILLGLLLQAPPVFGSPLYVGVADDLRRRLGEHLQDYENARANLRDQPHRAEEYHFRGKSLGERIAGAGIPLNLLDVYTLPVSEEIKDGEELENGRSVAMGAEWLIQRIFKPEMGRR